MRLGFIAAILVTSLPAAAQAAGPTAPLYTISRTIPLGAPDRWDYLTYDAGSHRIYAAHSTSVAVIDTQSGQIVGTVPVPGANGVAVVPSIGKGYGSRDKKAVLVFDLASLKVIKELPAEEDTDGVIYDPFSKRLFVMDGDPNIATVVDTANDTVVTQLPLGGKPEFAAADGLGKLFINITDKSEIIRVDTRTAKVDARWPIGACERPHGLAIDRGGKHLFPTCTNARMMVVDSTTGRILAQLPIGKGSDGAAFDPKRNLAFSSNGEGTLSIVRSEGAEKFTSLGDVATQPLARTITLDPESGRIYLLSGERGGSARLLFVDPAL